MKRFISAVILFGLQPGVYLTTLFILSFLISFYDIPNNLFFGPEQGIDFQAIKGIVVSHHFTLIGAKTDIQGIFHGPVYYYIAAIPFFLSRGNPLIVAAFLNILESVTVYLIYILGKELINRNAGIISAVLIAVSYDINIYSRWLSSHLLVIPMSVLFFIFLNRFLATDKNKHSKWNLILVAIVYVLLGQAEFLNFILFGAILLFVVAFFNKNFFKYKILSFISLFVLIIFSIGNYLLFDIRHNFLITKSLIDLIIKGKGYYVPFLQSVYSNISVYLLVVSKTITPFSIILASFFVIAGLYILSRFYLKENKRIILLFFWVYSFPITLLVFRHGALEQFFVGMLCGIILLNAIIIEKIFEFNRFLGYGTLVVLTILNLYALVLNLPRNTQMFFQSTQIDLKYSDEQKVIDTIYTRQRGVPFSYQAYTIPYWSQQGWDYLFWFFGKEKYGYFPTNHGNNVLYVIIQADPSNRKYQDDWLKNTVSKWGIEQKSENFHYGALRVLVLKT